MSDYKDLIKAVRDLDKISLELLYLRAAAHLTKRPVLLEWEQPELPEARGLTLRNGIDLLIQINPDLDTEQKFATFLHECAHGKLHFEGLAQRSDFDCVPEVSAAKGYQIIPDWLMEKRRAAAKIREQEAKTQAQEWMTKSGEGSVKLRLLYLLNT